MSDLASQVMANRQKFGTGDLSSLYGSGRLLEAAGMDLSPLFNQGGSTCLPLGRDANNPATGGLWDTTALQGHGLMFGATRSGKGVTSIIPALMSYAGSMVVIDPKGENAWITAERRRAMGQRVVILDPWNEVNRRYAGGQPVETVSNFNPLGTLDPADPDFVDEVAGIADAMIIPRGGNPHWDDSARDLFGGLAILESETSPGRGSIRNIRRTLTTSADNLQARIKDLTEHHPDSLAITKLARFLDSTDEISSIRSTAMTQTVFLDSAPLANSMESGDPPFDLAELATGRVTLYLVLPLDKLQTHGRWLRIILTLAIRAIAKQPTPPAVPVVFLLDEMGTVGPLQAVENAYGLLAGVGIRIVGYLQNLPQLIRDYPSSWETFFSNASVVQGLAVSDKTTSEYLSDLMGTYTIERLSYESAQARKHEKGLVGVGDSAYARPVRMPQEIREVPAELSLTRIMGGTNLLLRRMPYHAEAGWYDWYRATPQHPKKPRPVTVAEPVKKKSWFG